VLSHPGPKPYWSPALSYRAPHRALAARQLDDLNHQAEDRDHKSRDAQSQSYVFIFYRNHLLTGREWRAAGEA